LKESWDSFHERMLVMNPFYSLGKGMNVGELNPYVQNILMQVILEIFYRELNDDENRKKSDILLIVKEVLSVMRLKSDEKQRERLVSGLLFQGSERLSEAFEAIYFHEETGLWETQMFKYLSVDDLYTDAENRGSTLYKLSDVAQNMVFMSREIVQEFSITIEQLYSIQLIKNGSFKKAGKNLDHLISRVNRLIAEEISFQREMVNNPKILVYEEFRQRDDRKGEIDAQFEEEKKHFKTITSLIEKAKGSEEYADIKQDLFFLYERVEQARQLHDRLSNLVTRNIAIEIKLKAENPGLFWEKTIVSFRENIFDNWVVKHGITDFTIAEEMLGALFSPRNEFILPLDWIWGEQNYYESTSGVKEEEPTDEEIHFNKRITNWAVVAEAWEPVFDHLMQFGEYSLAELTELPLAVQELWFSEIETFEMWMMFDRKALNIQIRGRSHALNDERELLIDRLMQKTERFGSLEGKKIYTGYDDDQSPLFWQKTKVTPFKIYLKESVS
jgi:hypothetical protein